MDEIESLELKISVFLRYGVLFAGALMLVGWMILFINNPNLFEALKSYQETPLGESLSLAINNRSWGFLISNLGLVALISLPLIRVLLTTVLFFKQKENTLAILATIVLITLITSFMLGIDL